ncbi:UDP-glucuronosyl/UDP-glucosyltransferase [Parasponia andersonii]|uniref:UDP-glucuronosyl/UDP-glucosyltransferase n=1 Tax=Parasponia andersonii TaxID=3476 RepID=A0A2P5AP28_PARAD|nr:UDP-glucuronosyl/UDP-glucosyltransferase [Parasponia andersonii]
MIKIPTSEVGLPEGLKSFHMAVASSPEMHEKFFKATSMLGPQIEQLLNLIFHGTSYIALCASLCMYRYEPHKRVSSEYKPFIIPNLPDEIEFTPSRVPDFLKEDTESEFVNVIYKESKEAESRSYGTGLCSVRKHHYTNVLGIKAWHIGPLFLYDKGTTPKEKAERRIPEASIDEHQCLTCLDSKKPNSLVELALGLEDSGQQFIWVVQKEIKRQGVKEEWLPEGFEERMEGRGLIIRGRSIRDALRLELTLEGVCAGLPMVAWLVSVEQFYNEKLVTQILAIGIRVGGRTWSKDGGDYVRREVIEQAVRQVMEGEEAEEIRSKARGLTEMARIAIEEGGSSDLDLDALFEELSLARIAHDSSQGEFVTC